MGVLIHKFGLEFGLTSPEAEHSDYKNTIEAKIRKKAGIVYAEFSKGHPVIVAVEYDPSITTPDAIYKKTKRQYCGIKRKVFL
jgi:hypothetical protein